jgi:hypothetical protein
MLAVLTLTGLIALVVVFAVWNLALKIFHAVLAPQSLEMPGVARENIDVSVENGLLTVEGKINFTKYEGLQPIYSEYNIGPYRRSFPRKLG